MQQMHVKRKWKLVAEREQKKMKSYSRRIEWNISEIIFNVRKTQHITNKNIIDIARCCFFVSRLCFLLFHWLYDGFQLNDEIDINERIAL